MYERQSKSIYPAIGTDPKSKRNNVLVSSTRVLSNVEYTKASTKERAN